jgi:hypothetical protein
METLQLDLLGDEPDLLQDGALADDESDVGVEPLNLVMPASDEGGLNEYECNARVLMVAFCTYMSVWTAVVLVFVLTMAAANTGGSSPDETDDDPHDGSGSGSGTGN